ncbi:AMP-binding protein [Pseudobythopirellula maris]|uniref:AMP-binding protein n=1 Tax=Pseudobythopirellula maris TaxID=2527991 RepID=UPI0018D3B6CC|nr:AMP-binding protein [Pseudobythopirellula maris]
MSTDSLSYLSQDHATRDSATGFSTEGLGAAQTLVDVLRERAANEPNHMALEFLGDGHSAGEDDQAFTYGQLDRRARAIAAKLRLELEPGDRAMLVYPAGLDFVSAFVGCLYAGVVAVPATHPKPRRPMPRMSRIAEDSGAPVVLTTSRTFEAIDFDQQDEAVRALHWIETDSLGVASDEPLASTHEDFSPTFDDLAFLQYTSGSTSEPKGVMVSHGNLAANLWAIRRSFGIDEALADGAEPNAVFWLPAYHDMGLIGGVLTPLFVGGTSVLMSPAAFLQRPVRWLRAIQKYRATISGAPNFAYEYCVRRISADDRAGLDLGTLRLSFCGAEPVRADTLRDFADAFEPYGFNPRVFYPCYGLAEATLLAAGGEHDQNPTLLSVDRQALGENRVVAPRSEASQELVGCGSAPRHHRLLIVDPKTLRALPEGVVGEILVQGPSVARGYWRREETNDATFRARVPNEPGVWLRTGDLGFLHGGPSNDAALSGAPELFVTGRLKDVIILRGRNHYPQDIEQTAEDAHPAVLPGAAFLVDEETDPRLVVVCQVDRTCEKTEHPRVAREIRSAVVERHGIDPSAVVLIRMATLPITSSGKVQRSLCRERYLAGDLRDVYVMKIEASRPAKADVADMARADMARTAVAGASQLPDSAEAVETWLMAWLVERLDLSETEVYRDRPFAELGVDSVAAVELSAELEEAFGVELSPIVAWNHPTPASLAEYLVSGRHAQEADEPELTLEAASTTAGPDAAATGDAELDSLLAEMENLSPEEAAKLLSGEE